MPFLLYNEKRTGEESAAEESAVVVDESETANQALPPEHDLVPLFLIPGITGNGTEFQSLIEKLRSSGDKRPIYVYYHPAIVPDLKGRPYKENLTLEEQAKLMAECMKDRLPPGLTPYVMISYSSGCSLSALAAQLLNAENQVVKLFLIDGPSPEVARKYFSSSSDSVTTDLINIVKYAAKLSITADQTDEQFNLNLDLNKLLKKSPLEVMDIVAQAIIDQYGHIVDFDFFVKSLKVAKLGIHNLMTNEIKSPSHKIEKAYALITQETAKKYDAQYLGWEKYAETLSIFKDNELLNQEHTALLNDNGSAGRLATKIKRFTSRELTLGVMLDLHLEYIRTRFLSPKPVYSTASQPSSPPHLAESPLLATRLPHEEVETSPTTIETLSDEDPATNDSASYADTETFNALKRFFDSRGKHTLFAQAATQPQAPITPQEPKIPHVVKYSGL